MGNFIFLNDDFFLQDFDGVQMFCSFFSAKNNFSKCAFPENFQKLKMLQGLKNKTYKFVEAPIKWSRDWKMGLSMKEMQLIK